MTFLEHSKEGMREDAVFEKIKCEKELKTVKMNFQP